MHRTTGIYPTPDPLLEENENQETEKVLTAQKREKKKKKQAEAEKSSRGQVTESLTRKRALEFPNNP